MSPYLYCENNQIVVLLQSVYVITNHCRVLIVKVAPNYSAPLLVFALIVSFKKLKKKTVTYLSKTFITRYLLQFIV